MEHVKSLLKIGFRIVIDEYSNQKLFRGVTLFFGIGINIHHTTKWLTTNV